MNTWTIGKAARRAGVGVETIRFYERQGLIEQPQALLDGASGIFQGGRNSVEPEVDPARIKDLHAKIGELTVERDFLEHGLRLLPGRSARR